MPCFGIPSDKEQCRFCGLPLHKEVGGVRQSTWFKIGWRSQPPPCPYFYLAALYKNHLQTYTCTDTWFELPKESSLLRRNPYPGSPQSKQNTRNTNHKTMCVSDVVIKPQLKANFQGFSWTQHRYERLLTNLTAYVLVHSRPDIQWPLPILFPCMLG